MDDAYYLGADRITLDKEEDRARLVQRLRQYLELRNVSVLIGNGCSIPVGAPVISDTAKVAPDFDHVEIRLKDNSAQSRARELLGRLLPKDQKLGIEPLLAVLASLQALDQLLHKPVAIDGSVTAPTDVQLLERLLKKWLFHECKALTNTPESALRYHEELLRRLLLRSTSLPRAKIFTTNYDLLIERALDNLGVHYFDGFLGTLHRTLRTESYHYDLYYPGETTEGRVSRVDRVLHLYKLHGSINWRRRHSEVDDVVISHVEPDDSEYGDVMIYPSPLKNTELNGYPYSEMFRHFAAQIHQPQSVLFAVGYKFQDHHINRLIYQALSVPSFVLIVVIPTLSEPTATDPVEAREIWRLTRLGSKRILVLTGSVKDAAGHYIGGAGTLQDFSTKWLPDITELAVDVNARDEARRAMAPNEHSADDAI